MPPQEATLSATKLRTCLIDGPDALTPSMASTGCLEDGFQDFAACPGPRQTGSRTSISLVHYIRTPSRPCQRWIADRHIVRKNDRSIHSSGAQRQLEYPGSITISVASRRAKASEKELTSLSAFPSLLVSTMSNS